MGDASRTMAASILITAAAIAFPVCGLSALDGFAAPEPARSSRAAEGEAPLIIRANLDPPAPTHAVAMWSFVETEDKVIVTTTSVDRALGEGFYEVGTRFLDLDSRDGLFLTHFLQAGNELSARASVNGQAVDVWQPLPSGINVGGTLEDSLTFDIVAGHRYVLALWAFSTIPTTAFVSVEGASSSWVDLVAGPAIAANWFDFRIDGAQVDVGPDTADAVLEATFPFRSDVCTTGTVGHHVPIGAVVWDFDLEGPTTNVSGDESWHDYLNAPPGEWTARMSKAGVEFSRMDPYVILVAHECY